MVTENSKRLQKLLTDEIHPRVLGAELEHRMEEFRMEAETDEVRSLGSIPTGLDKVVRRPWLVSLGSRIDFRIARNGALFSVASINRHVRFGTDNMSKLMFEKFLRFSNLCAARMWKYCHRDTLVIPDNKLILRRDQLNDDAEKEPGLNKIVDSVEDLFKQFNFLGSVATENCGKPARRLTQTDYQILNEKMNKLQVEFGEKNSAHAEELNRLHQEIQKLNARLSLVLHTSSVNQ